MASITKTAHNKHLVRIRITGFPVVSKQFDSLKDAQVFAKKTEADMLRGRFVDLRPAEKTTLRSVIDDYPSSIPQSKVDAWTQEVQTEVQGWPDSPQKSAILNAIQNGDVRAEIFKWPQ